MKNTTLTQENLRNPEDFRIALFHHANLYMDTFTVYMQLCHAQRAYEARLECSDMTSWAKCLALEEDHPGRALPRKLYQTLDLAVTEMYAGLLEERRALAVLIRVMLQSEDLQQTFFGWTVLIDGNAVNGFLFVLFYEMEQVMLYQPTGKYHLCGDVSMPTAGKLTELSGERFDTFLTTLRNTIANTSNGYLPALVRYYRKCVREYDPVPRANEAEAYRQLGLSFPAVKDDFDVRHVPDIPLDEDASSALTVCLRCNELIYYTGDMAKIMDGDCPRCGTPLRYSPEE